MNSTVEQAYEIEIQPLDLTGRVEFHDDYLQIEGICVRGDKSTVEKGRKWRLSKHMLPEEVVQTTFLAWQAFVEHEVREGFLVNGCDVFSPHLDLKALAKVPHVKRSEA